MPSHIDYFNDSLKIHEFSINKLVNAELSIQYTLILYTPHNVQFELFILAH